ncbi:tetratricopeptide repeat protein 29 isoform X2 [Numida meleagris]|nr:tetratricopeptide repeat protein 29 isoform X2 [Numida meleagris]XP_021249529.1 tetratricopeptide repeat protein 29 isoform X2 [Numida meleagris]XP_021249531.1 tetratricopeptide repeat protein 29 isoform X2 [Numida meleagris]XP_021249532.1 tetratricopeptide repeat protein 29 isoform X2 [Numida meleagris]
MKVLPQEIIQSPPRYPRFEEPTICPPLDFARWQQRGSLTKWRLTRKIHLIKDKGGMDDYLAKNIKGLSKQEAAANRNSYKKNICIDMLRQGYHKSFSELFTLIQKWNALREAAGPGSAIWQQQSLEEQPDKLDQLYHFLTRAEAAQRAGHSEEVYDNQLNVAYCFNDPEEKELRNYFYEQCFNTAQLIKTDGGKRQAQAHAHMGLINEEQGNVMKAAEHYEAFYQLTEGSTWKDETGHPYNSLACEHLWRIYILMADKMLENKEQHQAIKILIKAFRMAKTGGDKKMEGETAYCLSLVYHYAGEEKTALSLLNSSIKIFTALCDSAGLRRAYEAIDKILVSQGKVAESLMYLEEFKKVAENARLNQSVVDACVLVGNIYNERGSYDRALEYFTQAFEAANPLNNLSLADETRTYCGIAKAHKLMVAFNSHIEAEDPISLKYLLAWKENRSDMCTDPLTVEPDKEMSPREPPPETSPCESLLETQILDHS